MTQISINTINPDSASIANKETINISFSTTDISASNKQHSILPSYLQDSQTVVIPNSPDENIQGYLYYTPIYREKLSYKQYIATVNKTFEELT